MSFSALNLHTDLLRGIADFGFPLPTPIQRDAIPPAMEGRDVLACAMTGSGKTAAFLLPILHKLLGMRRGTTRALVLAPTRELALQITEHLARFAAHTSLTGAAVYGGVPLAPQERAFRKGVDVLVATPGRLLDHLGRPYARLDGIEFLVLDEADRMLDMGFLPDVRRILGRVPVRRQTLLFCATLPPAIVTLSREMLRNPAAINVERKAAPATGVEQSVYPVRQDLKSSLLLGLLRDGRIRSALVFTRTKHRANRLALFLARNGVPCDRIHGNRSQGQRTEALARFKGGASRVLVATDVAARGIDVEALSHVVNFDVPMAPEDYIHRVGRTARAEATGDAFTFVSDQETGDLAAIERAVGRRLPRLRLEGFDYSARAPERLEIPIGERIAEIRARKSEERARSRERAARRPERAPAGPRVSRAFVRSDARRSAVPRPAPALAPAPADPGAVEARPGQPLPPPSRPRAGRARWWSARR